MPEPTIHRGGDTVRVSFSGTPVLDEVLRRGWSAGIRGISMFPIQPNDLFVEENHV